MLERLNIKNDKAPFSRLRMNRDPHTLKGRTDD